MKNEEFDEAIRKKLESLNQSYTESDIDKVYRSVARRRWFPRGKGGSAMLYTLSAVAFVALVYFSATYLNSRFKNEPALSQNQDTVGIPQVVTEESQVFVSDTTINPQSVVNSAHNQTIESKQKAKTAEVTDHIQNNNKSEHKTIASKASYTNNHSTISDFPIESNNPMAKTGHQNAVNEDHGNIVTLSENSTDITTKSVDVETRQQELTMPEETIKVEPITVKSADAKDANVPAETSPLPDKTDKKTNEDLPTQKPSPEFSILTGLNFKVSGQSITPGISAELRFLKHFGLNLGLDYSFYNSEKYNDKDDMFRRRHHNSYPEIDNHLSHKERITNVEIKNRLLQLPVGLSYYLPLPENFNISFTTGTNLDLVLQQNLKYTEMPDSSHSVKNDFKSKGKVVMLNNIYLAAGIEKQWNSWVFGLQPYYSSRIKSVFYKPDEAEFGITAKVLFRFGK